jgi:hypothetical protein
VRESVSVLDCIRTHTHTHPLIDNVIASGMVSITLIQTLSLA